MTTVEEAKYTPIYVLPLPPNTPSVGGGGLAQDSPIVLFICWRDSWHDNNN